MRRSTLLRISQTSGLLVAISLASACGDDGVVTTSLGSATDATTTDGPTTTTGESTSTTTSESGTESDGSGSDSDSDSETGGMTTIDPPMGECGDGEVNQADEECDDGEANADDAACTSTCTIATCGDGLVQADVEACDDANDDDTDACLTTCVAATCGDGFVQEGVEGCDDGNDDDADACSNACVAATCGDGELQGAEECDDANDVDTDECTNMCMLAKCGDMVVQEGVEECDDGNDVDTDECTVACVSAICGDMIVQEGVEECDDGNDLDSDECTNACAFASCGDGFVQEGVEECDDGNNEDNDGCSAECFAELRPNLLRCGNSSRDVMTMAVGLDLTLQVGCAPNNTHQAMLVTRSGHNNVDANALKAYLQGGGIVLTEYSNSDEMFSKAFSAVAQGPSGGSCRDVAPTVVQFSADDPFWSDNTWTAIASGDSGCGRGVQNFPEIVPLAGWTNTNVAIGYRDLGEGRLWLTDYDWQDNENYPFAYTASLMNYMITHK